ncbi:carbohydrate porin [Microcoleus sp. herbarium2]|uniref:carbohydrate porin n=1 Tax=Microcoleus sp. herbarium2 TaxID=3055433 RepID=UPI002FCEAF84
MGSNQYQIEANYYLPITDRIEIVPSLYVIGNLNNFSDNLTVFVGHLRTYFSF